MRKLIENLTPGERPVSLKLIGGMFAFYVLAMTTAAVMVAGHQSRTNLAQEAGTTVAVEKVQQATQTRSLAPQLAGFSSN